LKLQKIYNQLEDDKPVEPKLIAAELKEVADDLKKNADISRINNRSHNTDDFENKLHDIGSLRDALFKIDMSGSDIDSDDRKDIGKTVDKVARDLAHDQNLDLDNVNAKDLKKKGLTDAEIEEIMELSRIHKELEGSGPIDPSHIAEELEEVIENIKKSAAHSMVQDDDKKDGDQYILSLHYPNTGPIHEDPGKAELDKSMKHIASIREIICEIPDEDTKMGAALRLKVANDIEQTIKDYLEKDDIDVAKLNERKLVALELDEDEIKDVLVLVKLYKKAKGSEPIDNDTFAAELKAAMQDLARHAYKEYHEESHDVDDDFRKRDIEKKIEDLGDRIGKLSRDPVNHREIDLLLEDCKDIIGEIIGEEYIERLPKWSVDFAAKINPNKLLHVPKEEKLWIKAVQGFIPELKKLNKKEKIDKKDALDLLHNVEDLAKSVHGSKREIDTKIEGIAHHNLNINLLKDTILKIPTNREGTGMTKQEIKDLIAEIKRLAKEILSDFILDDIDINDFENLDIDGLALPEKKKDQLRMLQSIIKEL